MLSNTPANPTNQTTTAITVGGAGVAKYFYNLDNGTWSAEISVSTPLSLTNLASGIHNIAVLGKDDAGNLQPQNSSTKFSWKIDTLPPTVVLSDDHPDAILHGGDIVTIAGTFTEEDQIDETVPPTITIGTIVVNAAMVKIDNLYWTYAWNVPSESNGVQTVSITAKDRSGNSNKAATGKSSYTVDNILPGAPVINPIAIGENLSGHGNKANRVNGKLKSDFSKFKVNIANTNVGNKAGTLFIKLTDSAVPPHTFTTTGESIAANAPAADLGIFSMSALSFFADGDLNIEAWIVDSLGNESVHSSVKKASALSSTPPIASAPKNSPQKLKKGDRSTSTVSSSKPGSIYLIKRGESATIQAEIDVALAAWKGFWEKLTQRRMFLILLPFHLT
ncbi:MAG: hypothetical protein HQM08_03970 [Candidatus Riflebacteria bacterium]|nr:hypothetical protein [Candidatus Riflebacteria bacterium]